MHTHDIYQPQQDFRVRPDETTKQALERLGFSLQRHEPGDHVCRALRAQGFGFCSGRHIVCRGTGIAYLGCSPPVALANIWIAAGCPDDTAVVLP